jgi:hypothetical protein
LSFARLARKIGARFNRPFIKRLGGEFLIFGLNKISWSLPAFWEALLMLRLDDWMSSHIFDKLLDGIMGDICLNWMMKRCEISTNRG